MQALAEKGALKEIRATMEDLTPKESQDLELWVTRRLDRSDPKQNRQQLEASLQSDGLRMIAERRAGNLPRTQTPTGKIFVAEQKQLVQTNSLREMQFVQAEVFLGTISEWFQKNASFSGQAGSEMIRKFRERVDSIRTKIAGK